MENTEYPIVSNFFKDALIALVKAINNAGFTLKEIISWISEGRYFSVIPSNDLNVMFDFMKKGRKIEAIKHLRTITFLGLKESKDYLESITFPKVEEMSWSDLDFGMRSRTTLDRCDSAISMIETIDDVDRLLDIQEKVTKRLREVRQ